MRNVGFGELCGCLRRAPRRVIGGCWREARHAVSAFAQVLWRLFPGAPSNVQHAVGWLQTNEAPGGGIRIHSGSSKGYAEVTGYLIPTLLRLGQREYAARLARWLVSAQRENGAFADPDCGKDHVFDTAQALRGLLASQDVVPSANQAAERAARYLVDQMVDGGAGGFPAAYGGTIPESIHLYALPPLLGAAEFFRQPRWHACVAACRDYYLRHESLLDANSTLTHFLGYEIEALIELGQPALVAGPLEALKLRQAPSGALSATAACSWVCTPGLAQIALCWAKVGMRGPAEAAVTWLRNHQRRSGGFWGSYGYRSQYFRFQEISWAVKFYLDVELAVDGAAGA